MRGVREHDLLPELPLELGVSQAVGRLQVQILQHCVFRADPKRAQARQTIRLGADCRADLPPRAAVVVGQGARQGRWQWLISCNTGPWRVLPWHQATYQPDIVPSAPKRVDFVRIIAELRAAGYSYHGLAILLHCSMSTIRHLASGYVADPKHRHGAELLRILEASKKAQKPNCEQ